MTSTSEEKGMRERLGTLFNAYPVYEPGSEAILSDLRAALAALQAAEQEVTRLTVDATQTQMDRDAAWAERCAAAEQERDLERAMRITAAEERGDAFAQLNRVEQERDRLARQLKAETDRAECWLSRSDQWQDKAEAAEAKLAAERLAKPEGDE